jgi:hypothetical protein
MKASFLIPSVALLIACNAVNKPMTEVQKEAVKAEATVVVKNVFDVLALGNGEKRMASCENSSDFSFTLADGVFSFDGLKDYVVTALQDAEKETLETKSEKYIVIDPTCFTYIWHGKIDIYLKSGKKLTFNDYYSTWTFRKSEDTWKMVNGHESSKESAGK